MRTRKSLLPSSSQRPKFPPTLAGIMRFLVSKIVIILCVLLCLLAYARLHSELEHQPPLSEFQDYRSSTSSDPDRFVGTHKIALLFLARRGLPLDFLWGAFFKNGDAAKFSIYVHSEPGFMFDETSSRSAFFYGQQLNNSIQTVWGESSMIEAEKLLLEEALHDPANQRFVLLSDSCIPLYNFSYIYSYLMSSSKSFVDSFIDHGEDRYSPKMRPAIPKDKWRKGSQWITLVRRHAEIVADDTTILAVFKKICKRRTRINVNNPMRILQIVDMVQNFQQKILQLFWKQHNCIPDEHYVQTLFTLNELEDEVERRTLTYTLWNHSATRSHRRPWHPVTFSKADAASKKIREIKAINHVYYESEHRTESCHVSDKPVPCFLFARKFTRGAAMELLTEGMVGSYDPAAIALSNTAVL